MKVVRQTVMLLAAALVAGATAPAAAPFGAPDSLWRNPTDSVHVRLQSCGENWCGVVAWANDKAKADSARGGTAELVGTELFREFRETKPKVWTGKVFVPDLNKVFTGTLKVTGPDTLVARGCLLKGVGCKSQIWTRIP